MQGQQSEATVGGLEGSFGTWSSIACLSKQRLWISTMPATPMAKSSSVRIMIHTIFSGAGGAGGGTSMEPGGISVVES
jgi:hypothetical protein